MTDQAQQAEAGHWYVELTNQAGARIPALGPFSNEFTAALYVERAKAIQSRMSSSARGLSAEVVQLPQEDGAGTLNPFFSENILAEKRPVPTAVKFAHLSEGNLLWIASAKSGTPVAAGAIALTPRQLQRAKSAADGGQRAFAAAVSQDVAESDPYVHNSVPQRGYALVTPEQLLEGLSAEPREVAVEDLRVGDIVSTDRGIYRPIQWVRREIGEIRYSTDRVAVTDKKQHDVAQPGQTVTILDVGVERPTIKYRIPVTVEQPAAQRRTGAKKAPAAKKTARTKRPPLELSRLETEERLDALLRHAEEDVVAKLPALKQAKSADGAEVATEATDDVEPTPDELEAGVADDAATPDREDAEPELSPQEVRTLLHEAETIIGDLEHAAKHYETLLKAEPAFTADDVALWDVVRVRVERGGSFTSIKGTVLETDDKGVLLTTNEGDLRFPYAAIRSVTKRDADKAVGRGQAATALLERTAAMQDTLTRLIRETPRPTLTAPAEELSAETPEAELGDVVVSGAGRQRAAAPDAPVPMPKPPPLDAEGQRKLLQKLARDVPAQLDSQAMGLQTTEGKGSFADLRRAEAARVAADMEKTLDRFHELAGHGWSFDSMPPSRVAVTAVVKEDGSQRTIDGPAVFDENTVAVTVGKDVIQVPYEGVLTVAVVNAQGRHADEPYPRDLKKIILGDKDHEGIVTLIEQAKLLASGDEKTITERATAAAARQEAETARGSGRRAVSSDQATLETL